MSVVQEPQEQVAELQREVTEQRSSRRTLLRLASAVVAGGAATALVHPESADATTDFMKYGTFNDAGDSSTSLSSTSATTLLVQVAAGGTGVLAHSSLDGIGLFGYTDNPTKDALGVGGRITGTLGHGVGAYGGAAQLLLWPVANVGPALNVAHVVGEVAQEMQTLSACVGAGTPGTWRELASMASAGVLHAISPARVFDSRVNAQPPVFVGTSRTISVADKRDVVSGEVTQWNVVPVGATAIAYNLTIANTVGNGGFLAVNEGGNTVVGASAINWYGSGQKAANASVIKLNASRQVTVICGGSSGGSTHFIIDVVGYYR